MTFEQVWSNTCILKNKKNFLRTLFKIWFPKKVQVLIDLPNINISPMKFQQIVSQKTKNNYVILRCANYNRIQNINNKIFLRLILLN